VGGRTPQASTEAAHLALFLPFRLCYSTRMVTTEPRRPHTLVDLAQRIEGAGLRTPALALLAIFAPLAGIGQQLLLLSQPLWAAGQAERWMDALGEPGALEALTDLLSQSEGT